MSYNYDDRRSGFDRRTGEPDRRNMLDFARFGTDSEKRENIFDRRQEEGRRSSDLITVEELERMR